jgi:integrase/recombinase XerD
MASRITWDIAMNDFRSYLKLEKSLSQNSIDAYLHDIELLRTFFRKMGLTGSPTG